MRLIAAALLFALSAPLCLAQDLTQPLAPAADTPSGPTSAPKKPISFDVTAIDKSVDPCVDFYQYACGNWRKENPIPADQVRWGRFQQLADYNNYLLYTDLKSAADDPKTPLQTKSSARTG